MKKMIKICERCGRERRIYARGLCNSCYVHTHPSTKEIICIECKQNTVHWAKNMCRKCYNKLLRKKSKYARIRNKIGEEKIYIKIEKDVMSSKDATKYIKFKRQQILDDAIKNPKKYLKKV